MRSLMIFCCWLGFASYGMATQPNIVLIYGDDVGYGDIGCYGASTIPTPNIDRLAEQGLRITSGYCSSATCTPSRFSLLTGEYAWRTPGTGIAPPNSSALIRPGTPTLPLMLKQAGYRTGIVGKWHLGLGSPPKPNWSGEIKPGPLEIGFESCFILPTTNDRVPCVYVRNHRIVGLESNDPVDVFNKNPDDQPTGKSQRDTLKMDWSHGHNDSIVNGISRIGFMTGGHSIRWEDETMSEVFAKDARQFISKPDERPFFLFYSAHQIHVPRAPNERFIGSTPHGPRGDAMVELDWCVGEIVSELKEQGVLENTLILFTSDNGPVINDGYLDQSIERLGSHRPGGPYRGGKYSLFEAGTRVPWIVHWPKKVAPGVSDAMISQVDLCSSLASIAGVTDSAKVAASDSLDLSRVLLGQDLEGRDYVVEHSGSGMRLAIRRNEWKYIAPSKGPAVLVKTNTESARSSKPQLYNLNDDPGEQNNLAAENPQIVAELKDLLEKVKQPLR